VRNAIELADEDALMPISTPSCSAVPGGKACVPHMRKAGWGRIVNVGGLTARCTEALSGMRNTALVHFTKNSRRGGTRRHHRQHHPSGRYPHRTYRGMVCRDGGRGRHHVQAIVEREAAGPAALKRMLEVAEVADPIVFLCSQLGSGITGESIAVDGGLSRAVFL
jgi:NAD(P)-dependent dehydrogenase (short-subunit alcohol dehydrogenase family)